VEILYPPLFFVEDFHNTLIQQRGSQGYVSKGMVGGCIEWAKTEVYNFIPFPGVLKRAAAMMYAYVTFHPFADGNKRTALMVTSFFLFINGYSFEITDDSPDFALQVAKRCSDDRHNPTEEIERIATWLRPKITRPVLTTSIYRRARSRLSQNAGMMDLLKSSSWATYYILWRIETTKRFRELLIARGKSNGSRSRQR